jgi:hypothetical protein
MDFLGKLTTALWKSIYIIGSSLLLLLLLLLLLFLLLA